MNPKINSVIKWLTFQKVKQTANGLSEDQFCAGRSEKCVLKPATHTDRDYGLYEVYSLRKEALKIMSGQKAPIYLPNRIGFGLLSSA